MLVQAATVRQEAEPNHLRLSLLVKGIWLHAITAREARKSAKRGNNYYNNNKKEEKVKKK